MYSRSIISLRFIPIFFELTPTFALKIFNKLIEWSNSLLALLHQADFFYLQGARDIYHEPRSPQSHGKILSTLKAASSINETQAISKKSYQAWLDEKKVPPSWVPHQYRCCITNNIINGISSYLDSVENPRFDRQTYFSAYLPEHIDSQNSFFYKLNLKFDYILDCKIKIFMKFMRGAIAELKLMPDQKAEFVIKKFVVYTDKQFSTLGAEPFSCQLSHLTEKLSGVNKTMILNRQVDRAMRQTKMQTMYLDRTANHVNQIKQAFFYNQQLSESKDKAFIDLFINRYGDAYQQLGLESNATKEEIKCAFKKLALIYHPDKMLNSESCEWNIILEAREILLDDVYRNYHDKAVVNFHLTYL